MLPKCVHHRVHAWATPRFATCGSILRDRKDCSDQSLLKKIELKFRDTISKFLVTDKLPTPILEGVLAEEGSATDAPKSTGPKPIALLAPLSAKGGAFAKDSAFEL